MTIGLSILVFGAMGLVSSITSSLSFGEADRESTLALQAARATMERLSAAKFDEVLALYDADGTNDPGGEDTAPGPSFTVEGLNPQDGSSGHLVGRIEFPALDPGTGGLFETTDAPEMGLPRDLTADGVIDGADHRGDYHLLPVRIVVEWRGMTGERSLSIPGLLADRQ